MRATRFADTIGYKTAVITTVDAVEVEEMDEHGHVTRKTQTVTDDLYCVCKTKWDASQVMIGCSGACEGWFHIKCLKLTECAEHKPPPGFNGTYYCLVTPTGTHMDVSGEYFCPQCTGTKYGSSQAGKS